MRQPSLRMMSLVVHMRSTGGPSRERQCTREVLGCSVGAIIDVVRSRDEFARVAFREDAGGVGAFGHRCPCVSGHIHGSARAMVEVG